MPKKVPLRMCLGCREMKPKTEIIRVVKSPDDEISLDITGKKPGRGAYVCRDTGCLNRAVKSKALSRAFKMPVPNDIFDELQKQIDEQKSGQENRPPDHT